VKPLVGAFSHDVVLKTIKGMDEIQFFLRGCHGRRVLEYVLILAGDMGSEELGVVTRGTARPDLVSKRSFGNAR